MKKKIAVLGTALMVAAAITACGDMNDKTAATVPVETTVPAETMTPAESKAPETDAAESAAKAADGAAGAAADAESGLLAQEPSEEREELSADEMKTFAESVKAAVADKNLESLAGLCAYPVYISMKEGEGQEVESRDAFIKLKPEQVFTDGMLKEIAAADVNSLEQFRAGVILGGENSITFSSVGGKAAVTSIILE